MQSIKALVKKLEKEEQVKEAKQACNFVPKSIPSAVYYSDIIVDPDYPRALCRYRDLRYLNSNSLIDSKLYYYNASLVDNGDTYRLFYRVGDEPKGCRDMIATCLLKKNLDVVKSSNMYIKVHSNWLESANTTKLKEMIPYMFNDGEHVEDPRAVKFNDSWFVFYTDGLKIGVAKLDMKCETLYTHYLSTPKVFKHGDSDGREKNWIPFVSNNNLYILYSDTPRSIIRCVDTGSDLQFVNFTKQDEDPIKYWNYGNIRGGAPPVIYDSNFLIWFFHSQKKYETHIGSKTVYMMGAYVSQNTYPFTIVKYCKLPLLIGIASEASTTRSLQDYVVFPCGAVKTVRGWKVSMGVNDVDIAFLDVEEKHFLWENVKEALTVLKF
jgi:predicted GH43/DUF377 family glycosyl hydrolase